jgi:hypothetical protein
VPAGRASGRDGRQRLHGRVRPRRARHPSRRPPRRQLRGRPDGLARLEDEDRIAFRYAPGDNPNGSTADIAGVLGGPRRNVLGLMPHPERAADPLLGSTDGVGLFRSLLGAVG